MENKEGLIFKSFYFARTTLFHLKLLESESNEQANYFVILCLQIHGPYFNEGWMQNDR